MDQDKINAMMRHMGEACRAHLVELHQKHGFGEEDIEFPPFYMDGQVVGAEEEQYATQWLIDTLLSKIDAQQRTISTQQIDGTAKLESLRAAKARIKELEGESQDRE